MGVHVHFQVGPLVLGHQVGPLVLGQGHPIVDLPHLVEQVVQVLARKYPLVNRLQQPKRVHFQVLQQLRKSLQQLRLPLPQRKVHFQENLQRSKNLLLASRQQARFRVEHQQ